MPQLTRTTEAGAVVGDSRAHTSICALSAAAMLLYVSTLRSQRAELRRARDQANALARLDALTGLGNRRAFDEALQRERDRAGRYGTPLSLILADLDDFKTINDQHGHPAGDEILRAVSAALASSTRSPDECFRWGGDEFAVVLPQTPRDEARRVASRIREAIPSAARTPDSVAVGISVGVAELTEDQAAEDLLGAADRDLLAQKSHRLK
jgi:diguanylate cyclase (GGDEF)-like protein